MNEVMKKTVLLWESIALLLVVVAVAAFFLPLADGIFMPREPDEIVVRMSIKESGGFDPEVITVKKGQTVRLVLISMDVSHGFTVEGLDIDVKIVNPEKKVVVEFTPEEEGVYMFKCTVQCSPLHHYMRGLFIVEG